MYWSAEKNAQESCLKAVWEIIRILNGWPEKLPDYEFFMPESGKYKLILNSDEPEFGGHNRVNDAIEYPTQFNEQEGRHYLKIYVPNRAALVFGRVEGRE